MESSHISFHFVHVNWHIHLQWSKPGYYAMIYLLKYGPYSDFTHFSSNVLFSVQDPTLHLVNTYFQSSIFPFFFMTLTLLMNPGPLFCRTFLNCGLSAVLSWPDLDYAAWWKGKEVNSTIVVILFYNRLFNIQ